MTRVSYREKADKLSKRTYIESITIDESLFRLRVVEHLIEQQHTLLYPVELLLHLLLVIGLLLRLLVNG